MAQSVPESSNRVLEIRARGAAAVLGAVASLDVEEELALGPAEARVLAVALASRPNL